MYCKMTEKQREIIEGLDWRIYVMTAVSGDSSRLPRSHKLHKISSKNKSLTCYVISAIMFTKGWCGQ